jgi:hypothetical protein
MQIRFYFDEERNKPHIQNEGLSPKKKEKQMSEQKFPKGWSKERVEKLLSDYEQMDEDVLIAEDEGALEAEGQTLMSVPNELVQDVRELITKKQHTAS